MWGVHHHQTTHAKKAHERYEETFPFSFRTTHFFWGFGIEAGASGLPRGSKQAGASGLPAELPGRFYGGASGEALRLKAAFGAGGASSRTWAALVCPQ
jgi:hypothetical protein